YPRRSARSADTSAGHATSSNFCIIALGHFSFPLRTRRRLRQLVSPLSRCWSKSRNGSRSFGKTLASGKENLVCSVSTPEEKPLRRARLQLLLSSSATANSQWTSRANCLKKACLELE